MADSSTMSTRRPSQVELGSGPIIETKNGAPPQSAQTVTQDGRTPLTTPDNATAANAAAALNNGVGNLSNQNWKIRVPVTQLHDSLINQMGKSKAATIRLTYHRPRPEQDTIVVVALSKSQNMGALGKSEWLITQGNETIKLKAAPTSRWGIAIPGHAEEPIPLNPREPQVSLERIADPNAKKTRPHANLVGPQPAGPENTATRRHPDSKAEINPAAELDPDDDSPLSASLFSTPSSSAHGPST